MIFIETKSFSVMPCEFSNKYLNLNGIMKLNFEPQTKTIPERFNNENITDFTFNSYFKPKRR